MSAVGKSATKSHGVHLRFAVQHGPVRPMARGVQDESSARHLFTVTFHAHSDGTYYVEASGESFEWGGYELRVTDVTQDD